MRMTVKTKEVKHPFNPRTLADTIQAVESKLTIVCTKHGELIRVDDRGEYFYFTVQDDNELLFKGKFNKNEAVGTVLDEEINITWVSA
jgi:hypothetical protein